MTHEAIRVSFRDPAGCVFRIGPRVLRSVGSDSIGGLREFLATDSAKKFFANRYLVGTHELTSEECAGLATPWSSGGIFVEHEAVPFPTYPYEWSPKMLHAAARLTLEIAEGCLDEGFSLKDATPYNVLFRGPSPVFVDLLSFEKRDPRDAVWIPNAQFIRTFLLPLLASKRLGIPPAQVFLSRRDGLEPEELHRMLGPVARLRPPALGLVSAPVWLAGRAQRASDGPAKPAPLASSSEKARFILDHAVFGPLKRALRRIEPAQARSKWSEYTEAGRNNYDGSSSAEKVAFVADALGTAKPAAVLDVGCNTGEFAAMAARAGARVVAIDSDPVVVDRTWERARRDNLDILPLAVDLTRPSPAVGWRNREHPSFLERAEGTFDLVLMLAVLHHMLVSERVPLEEIVDSAARLTTERVLIEYVGPEDSMFRRIARGREALHADLSPDRFETAFAKRFSTERVLALTGSHRRLYLFKRT